MVVAGLIIFATAIPSAASADTDLSRYLVDFTSVFPTAVAAAPQTIKAQQVYAGSGVVGATQRANVRGGVARNYELGGTTLRDVVVEFQDNDWASDKSRYPEVSQVAGGTFNERRLDQARGGSREYALLGVKGRIAFGVWIFHSGTAEFTEDERASVAKLYDLQSAAIPLLKDLPEGASSPAGAVGRAFGIVWGISTTIAILLLSLIGWVSRAVRDRGTREWIGRWRLRVPLESGTVDITRQVARQRLSWMSVWQPIRTLLYAVAIGALLGAQGIGVVEGLLIFAGLVLIVAVIEVLLQSRGTQRRTTRAEISILALGAAASAVVVVLGYAMVGAAATVPFLAAGLIVALMVPMFAMGGTIIGKGRGPLRIAHRILQPIRQQQIERDHRKTVLLLRSFKDESLEVVPPARRTGIFDGLAGEAYVRFEEVIAWEAWRTGALTAIAPAAPMAPLGALRKEVDDSEWTNAARTAALDAQAILLVVGRSPSLVWEIQSIRHMGLLSRCLFVFPPVAANELDLRIRALAAALGIRVDTIASAMRRRRLVAFRFDESGNAVRMVCGGRPAEAYVVALQQLSSITSLSRDIVVDPAPEIRDETQMPSGLIEPFDVRKVGKARKSVISRVFDFVLNFVPI